MTRTLTELLDIEWKFMTDVDDRGLRIAEQLFQSYGSPTEPRALLDVLEKILLRMQDEGIPYPKILLLRKKQLQRKEWQPRVKPVVTEQARLTLPRKSEDEIVAEARSAYTPEQFERWSRMHEDGKRLRDGLEQK
jgi:hypothetical protein